MGQLVPRHRPRRQLAGLVGTSAVLLAALTPSSHIRLLGVLLLLLGLVSSPMLITTYVAADELARHDQQREASTWVSTANNVGLALGAAAAGFLVDRVGPASVFAAGSVACILTLLVVVSLGARLTPRAGCGGTL